MRRKARLLGAPLLAALLLVVFVPAAGASLYFGYASSEIVRSGNDGSTASAVGFLKNGVNGASVSNVGGMGLNASSFYWANIANGSIWESNLDGSNPHAVLTGLTHLLTMTIDSNYIYYALAPMNCGVGTACGSIGRANLDGSSPNNTFITTDTNNPSGIAVNASKIYWSNEGESSTTGNGDIADANLDGSGATTIVPATEVGTSQPPHGSLAGPQGVVLDSNFVYWANFYGDVANGGNNIGRANLDGTSPNPEFLVTPANASGPVSAPIAIGMDAFGNLYWPQFMDPNTGVELGNYGRATLNGQGQPSGITGDFFPFTMANGAGSLVGDTLRGVSRVLSCSPAMLTQGTPSTCTFTVTDVDTVGSPSIPTGTVTFSNTGIGSFSPGTTCPLAPTTGESAACSVTYTPGSGAQQLTATTPGDGVHQSATATFFTDPTTTAVSCSPTSVEATKSTSCTATVTDTAQNTHPSGTVTFSSSSDPGSAFSPQSCGLGSQAANSSSCEVTYTPQTAGTPTVTALYPGVSGANSDYAASSGTQMITVTPVPDTTTTGVACSPSAPPGLRATLSTTCTATVTDTAASPIGSPTGTVSFTVSSAPGGSSPTFTPTSCALSGSGDRKTATCSVSYTESAAGSPKITGTYPATGNFAGSTGNQTLTYGPPPDTTTTAVSCTPSSLRAQTATSCTATVTDTAASSVPTGTVNFTSSADSSSAFSPAASCTLSGATSSTSKCSVTYTPSAGGGPTVTATYPATPPGFNGSSGSTTLTVHHAAADTTTTTVACLPSSPPAKTSTQCTATVVDTDPAPSSPTGLVAFSSSADGSGAFSPASTCTLVATGDGSSSSCSVAYTPSSLGPATVTASFDGNTLFAASSGNVILVVGAPPAESTTTTVSCVPAAFPVAGSTACTVTVTDTGANPSVPAGSAAFSSTDAAGSFDHTSCTLVGNGDGKSASCAVNYTAPDAGSPTINVAYGGNATFQASNGSASLMVSNRATTTAVSCTPSSLSTNGSTACTATVTDTDSSPVTPTGTVGFSSSDTNGSFDSTTCPLAAASASTASCTVNYTPTAAGSPTITASYPTGAEFDSSTGTATLTVSDRPTTTSVDCEPSTLPAATQTTCTATVVDNSASPVSPTGSVSFSSTDAGGTFSPGPSCPLSPAGDGMSSTCSVSYTPLTSSYPPISGEIIVPTTITATYVADPGFTTSSGTAVVLVNPQAAVTSVACNPASLPAGASSSCTVTVSDASPSPSTPTGTVTLSSDDTNGQFVSTTCSLAPVDNADASCSVGYAQPDSGTPTITASYPGDSSHGPSSGTTQITFTARTTTTALSCSPSSLPATTSTTCTATVADTDTAPVSTPTGAVSFSNVGSGSFTPSTKKCTLVAVDGSHASCTILYTPSVQQTQQLTASYPGDSAHGSSSGQSNLTVGFAPADPTTTAIACSPTSLQAKSTTTCGATVTDTSATPSTPTGTVSFSSDSAGPFQPSTGSCAINPSGIAQSSCTVTFAPSQAGSRTVTASFVGNTGFSGSSAQATLSISALPPDPTSTAVVCAPGSVQVGTASTCIVTVVDTHAAPVPPTGTVSLSSSAAGRFVPGASCTLATAAPDRSLCSVAFTPAAAGSFVLTAAYGGTPAFVASSGQTTVTATAVPLPPSGKKPPSNVLTFGKLVLNRKAGTGLLFVNVPDVGRLVVSGSGVKTVSLAARGRMTLKVSLSATGSKLKALRRKGRVSLSLKITFTPVGGSRRSASRSVVLVLRRRKA